MKRAVYEKQFKMAAIKVAQIGKNLFLKRQKNSESAAAVCDVGAYDEYGESAFPGHGNALFNSTYEIKKLQKQNEELKMENEILKNSRPS